MTATMSRDSLQSFVAISNAEVPGVFVTATGTDIGKTFVATELIRYLRRRGRAVRAIKPIVTGYSDETAEVSDCALLVAALGQPFSRSALDAVSPWRYRAALGPSNAAALEGAVVDYERILAFTLGTLDDAATGFTLVEGLGGVMVPLDGSHTLLDLMARTALPVVLIAGTYLGSLSHTLTALAALCSRDLRTICVINETFDSSVTVEQTVEALLPLASKRNVPLVRLRRNPSPAERESFCSVILHQIEA